MKKYLIQFAIGASFGVLTVTAIDLLVIYPVSAIIHGSFNIIGNGDIIAYAATAYLFAFVGGCIGLHASYMGF